MNELFHIIIPAIIDFHGLWGLNVIPDYISIPLTVFACVGIINAINLIDGVDGYSSGYSIVSCILFGVIGINLFVVLCWFFAYK